MTDRNVGLGAETVERLTCVSTATLTSILLKKGLRNVFLAGLVPTRPDLRMIGSAFTLRYAPAREDIGIEVDYDNDTNIQRLAVEAVESGEVLVIDARGDCSAASFGHILATRLQRRGVAGLVSDGALRDSDRFAGLDLPAYVKGAHATTSAVIHHPVDMNVPIGCAGVLVIPGDIVVGDAEGVVVIPSGIVDEVAESAHAQEEIEAFVLRKVEAGASIKGVYPPDESTTAEFRMTRTDRV